MLDPIELNKKSTNSFIRDNEFGLTWFDHGHVPLMKSDLQSIYKLLGKSIKINEYKRIKKILRPNLYNVNIRGAWENDTVGTDLPVAIHPTYVHERMHTQKSRFTIHGKIKRSISDLVDSRVLRKYVIPAENIESIKTDLRMLGFTKTSVYPDLDNLAKELSELY